MRVERGEQCAGFRRGLRRGFTLIEMLVAIAVIGIAVTVFVTFYRASIDLSRTASNRMIAANLAEERLASLVSAPGAYKWMSQGQTEDTPFDIQLSGEDPKAGNPVDKPAAMPADPKSFDREEARYENFRWEAKGKLAPGGAYYEVTVVVRYSEQGRAQLLAITSAVPARAVPDSAKLAPAENAQ